MMILYFVHCELQYLSVSLRPEEVLQLGIRFPLLQQHIPLQAPQLPLQTSVLIFQLLKNQIDFNSYQGKI